MTATTKRDAALDRWVKRALESAPPLTDEKRARLATLLSGGDGR